MEPFVYLCKQKSLISSLVLKAKYYYCHGNLFCVSEVKCKIRRKDSSWTITELYKKNGMNFRFGKYKLNESEIEYLFFPVKLLPPIYQDKSDSILL